MSDIQRRPRSDATRNVEAIVGACLDLLGAGADPSMADIASAAGLARQTVYAHFPTRKALLAAALERATAEVAETLAGTEPDSGPLDEAIDRWVTACWDSIDRLPALLNPVLTDVAPAADPIEQHLPIIETLRRLAGRATKERRLPPALSVDWLMTATLALGHAAAAEVAAERMSHQQAQAAFSHAVHNLFGSG